MVIPMRSRVAVVFPGEPSDRSLAAPKPWLSDPAITSASVTAGVDIARALSGRSVLGPAIVQPAVVALELVAWRRLRLRGVRPMLVAGQGVGEIAAWAATGAIEHHDAHKLAALRGAAVQLASLVHPTARRAAPGGWNTIAMAPAREALAGATAQVPRFTREIAQVASLDGAVLADDDAPDLGAQLVEPASWGRVIDTFRRFAITHVIVLPPSRVLRNLLHDALGPTVEVQAADDDLALDRLGALATPVQRKAQAS
jgi:malonyl CoA-acyl carrier protein transacylase